MNKVLLASLTALTVAVTLSSSRSTAAPPAGGTDAPVATRSAHTDLEKGKKKCAICHGPKLCGKAQTPAIKGLSRPTVFRALKEPTRAMKALVRGLSDAQIRSLAGWVSAMERDCAVDKYK